jgi:hypothetical protein
VYFKLPMLNIMLRAGDVRAGDVRAGAASFYGSGSTKIMRLRQTLQ